jgi:non-heme chloroperoxidase
MPYLNVNGLDHNYEQIGASPPLVWIHGAFVDSRMWEPQMAYFAPKYRVVRYDLRGHGKTGPSDQKDYSMATFAQDLSGLLEAFEIRNPIVCGLSLGGMIAQTYAVQNQSPIKALVLADTAVSVSLTLADKLQRYVLFPRWAMLVTIRMMNVENFTRFSFWLARATRSEDWIGRDEATRSYIEGCMLQMDQEEYIKIYKAIYDFHLLPLERITVPTLVLNGEHESKSVFRHTQEILKRVKGSQAKVVTGAGHTSNLENAELFNRTVDEFLQSTLSFQSS